MHPICTPYGAKSRPTLLSGRHRPALGPFLAPYGDTVREATGNEVKALRSENRELKEVVAEMTLKNRVLKKSLTGLGEEVSL